MKIVLAGASGLLGTHLRAHLAAQGHELIQLVRREPQGPDEVRWDPHTAHVDTARLEGADAVINLAGAGVGDKRWTTQYKIELRTSRVDVTRFLARTIAHLKQQPKVLLNGSAIGIYGDGGDRPVDESSAPGEGFLADLCVEWEAATAPARDARIRVVNLRTGLVLTPKDGFLGPQMLPAKLGLNGPIGGGKQYQSWVHLQDWLDAVTFALTHDEIVGPIDITAPNPARQKDLAKALGRVVHRPAFMPVPGFALKVLLGGFSVEVLEGARVLPTKLEKAGFTFSHPQLDEALADILSADADA